MSCCVILDRNLIDEAAAVTCSSEDADYPIENALDLDRRKRVWRSAGYWNIESGSNTLVLQDVIGVNLTATLPVDEYSSDAALFAALKTCFELVSDSTFTFTRDTTTRRIKVTAVLAGGASVFRLILTDSGSTALAAILGFDNGADLTGALTYTADLLRIHTKEFIRLDMGFPVTIHAMVAWADRNRPMKISPNAVVRALGSQGNDFDNPLVDVDLEVRTFNLGLVDANGIGGEACRYWQIDIVDTANPWGYVEIGAFFVGTKTTLDQGSPQFPLENENIDMSLRSYSEGGQAISGRRAKGTSLGLQWSNLTAEDYETITGIFEEFGISSSFVVALDQQGAFSTDPLLWTRIVKFAVPPTDRLGRPNNWALTWNLKEDL